MKKNKLFTFITILIFLIGLSGCETPQSNSPTFPLTLSTNVDGVSFSSDLIKNYDEGDSIELEILEIEGYNFVHWMDLSNERVLSESESLTIIMSRAQRIQAIYEKGETLYEVGFLDSEGLLETILVSDSAIIETFPAARVKEGHIFTRWNYSNSPVNDDLFIDAVYEKESYTISYFDGETLLFEESIPFNNEIIEYIAPSKDDFNFIGWDKSIPERMPSEDISLNAVYEETIRYYEVVFISEESIIDQFLVTEGSMALAPNFNGNKEGYTFINWEPSLRDIQKNTTFNAVYIETIPDTVVVSFISRDNELVSRVAIQTGTDAKAPLNPTSEGYTFTGWDKALTNITEDTTFNALFTLNSYSFDTYVDGVKIDSKSIPYESNIEPPDDPTKEGYTFVGWNPTIPEKMPAQNISVHAIFEEIINYYTVTFLDQGTVIDTFLVTEGATAVAPEFTGTKDGYTFTNWDKSLSNISENTTFNAVYEPNTYQALFYVDGSLYQNENYDTDETIVVPNDPVKTGHVFINWSPTIPSLMPSNNVSFTAVFESITTEPSERLELRFDEEEDHFHSLNDDWQMTCEAFDTETEEVLPCYVENDLDTSILGSQVITYYGYDSEGLRYEVEITETVFIDETVLDIDYQGYYDGIEGLYGEALLLELREIIQEGFNPVTYGEARYVLEESDVTLTDDTELLLIYDRTTTDAIWDAGADWNREHVWSQSYLDGSASNSRANIASDVHNLRAADPGTNSSRGNKYFDFSTTSSSYYPGPDRGDVARIYFYMIVMYPQLSLSDNPSSSSLTMGMLSSLLAFHYDDPVDAFEHQRNDIIFSYQNNRNPFIDHPHLIDLIFFDSDDLPAS